MTRTALILGGAACVWSDFEAYTGTYQGVVGCNDIGVAYKPLQAWVTLHPEHLAGKKKAWLTARRGQGWHDVPIYCHSSGVKQHGPTFGGLLKPAQRFYLPGCLGSGSTGMLAICVALYDLGFDNVVLCGVPMDNSRHFHNGQHGRGWEFYKDYRRIWEQIKPEVAERIRSMSGWTREHFGSPEAPVKPKRPEQANNGGRTMLKVKNTTKKPIPFITGQVLAPGEVIELDDRTVVRNEPWITGQMKRGFLQPAEMTLPQKTRSEIPESPEDIDELPFDTVKDLIEAHGLPYDGLLDDQDPREQLKKVMFVDGL